MNKKYEETLYRLITTDVKEVNDMFLFSQAAWNGLYVIDKQTRKIIYNTTFEDEPFSSLILYYSLQIIGTKAVFIPHSAKRIAIFDYECKSLKYLEIESCREDYNEKYRDSGKFAGSFKYGSFIYMLGYSYPAIIKLDILTLNTTYITDWVEDVNRYVENGDVWGYFSDGYVFLGSKVILPLGCMSGFLELDLLNDKTRLIHPGISIKRIGGIASFDRKKIWITARAEDLEKVIIWDMRSGEHIEIALPDCFPKTGSYYAPVRIEGKIYIFPEYKGYIYVIDEKNLTVKRDSKLDGVLRGEQRADRIRRYITLPYKDENYIILISGWDHKWHIFNLLTGAYCDFEITDNIDLERYFSEVVKYANSDGKTFDELDLGLSNFIRGITLAEQYHTDISNKIGEKIYINILTL